ncbi:MAG: cobalt-precorrin-5B (C(1))-methyltransferase CbiD [Alphaproteobacteria bacterium]|uniref:Cobalt-precorrin-5B C(1)-methyltransferase n=1 Tax=Candidatus Nitrobium versatile TaxID=2884831 RepID=A0A953J3K5_9BACT|nr:cobalt-precorrin-5B (C(1))-methyltransferase CbiD [Candidatus Nitrobium versatile]
MESKSRKKLRSGYTTGACAAAAAKAATLLLLGAPREKTPGVSAPCLPGTVEIPFPDGTRVSFPLKETGFDAARDITWASVIKDAGDDPDVTNGAEIRAEARLVPGEPERGIVLRGGRGVGIVTKPGLSVPVGEAAINPGPRRMIGDAVREAMNGSFSLPASVLEITISVPAGEELAKKTLNYRLGIVGGISILGTTGIVRPISAEAWTASITASLDVARAMAHETVVLSSGRTSERAHMERFHLPEEAYVMMGDYLEFSLRDAGKHGFREIHLCAQWAKMLKIGMATPQTHVRHGALDSARAAQFLKEIGIGTLPEGRIFNTAREIFDLITTAFPRQKAEFLARACSAAKAYAEGFTGGIPVTAYLVSYEGEIIARNE